MAGHGTRRTDQRSTAAAATAATGDECAAAAPRLAARKRALRELSRLRARLLSEPAEVDR